MKSCIAAVDMGTNSFHLLIVRVKKDGSFKIIDREREVIRLGLHEGTDLDTISEGETERTIDLLLEFNKIAKFYGANLRAIATSAVREAKNKEDFITKVFDSTGIEVEAIDGKKEAELIYLGVQHALNVRKKRILCIDIGGGSTEFLLGHSGKTVFADSVKIGAVRLSKKFFPNYYINEATIQACDAFIKQQLKMKPSLNPKNKFDFAVGTSGTILAAAGIIQFKRNNRFKKSLNGFSFTAGEMNRLTSEILKCESPVDRLSIRGMEVKRADIIPTGMLILRNAFETFKLNEMTVSENALREGIIIETIKQMDEIPSLSV